MAKQALLQHHSVMQYHSQIIDLLLWNFVALSEFHTNAPIFCLGGSVSFQCFVIHRNIFTSLDFRTSSFHVFLLAFSFPQFPLPSVSFSFTKSLSSFIYLLLPTFSCFVSSFFCLLVLVYFHRSIWFFSRSLNQHLIHSSMFRNNASCHRSYTITSPYTLVATSILLSVCSALRPTILLSI